MNQKPQKHSAAKRLCEYLAVIIGLSVHTVATAETATYQVTFDAIWSADTHPTDFPRNPHFSPLIGGTHNNEVRFWETGGIATQGIEWMAELGSTSGLRAEVDAAITSGQAGSVVSGSGIRLSPDATSLEFNVTEDHSLITLVSMVAPSPDWFVGSSGLNLRPDNAWVGKIVHDLFVYDAGTDSGVSFSSQNDDTDPQELITRLDVFPLESHAPFGTFTFLRVLDGDYNQTGTIDAGDMDQLTAEIRQGGMDLRFDVNQDGTLNTDDRTEWLAEIARTSLGDSNLDHRFDSGDLVQVFTAGEYEDSIAFNSGWAEGDWDGDGDFRSSDLVAAFQTSTYETPAASQPVPEPQGLLILIGFLFTLPIIQRRRA